MKSILYSILITSFFVSCSPLKIAVDDKEWRQKEELVVKGRNGFLIKQKLSFGEFKTTSVQRSWTKGTNWGRSLPISDDWVEKLNVEFVRRKQTVRFRLTDTSGNESEVTAFSKVNWTDLTIGNNPNSVVNIIGDLLKIGDDVSNTYAVRIYTARNELPWEMIIDNNAAQANSKKYRGLLAKSKNAFYTVSPVYKVMNNKGNAVALPLGGSVGFEFRNQAGVIVAALSLIDGGIVYFNKLSANEKFLLANASAALLLQEQLQ